MNSKIVKVAEFGKGFTLYKKPNGVGGYSYYSDSCGALAQCLDTAICGFEELTAIISNDHWLSRNMNNKLLEDLEYLKKENEALVLQNNDLRKKIRKYKYGNSN